MRLPLEQLMEKYQKNLYLAAYNVCRNSEDANDVVQDTFIRYYRTTIEFDSESHLRAWLFRVAVNRAKDLVRSFWHKNKMTLNEDILNIPAEDPETVSLIETVMKLPEKIRIVIHLYYYEEYKVREIASILRISEGSVKMRLSRGRSLMRQILKEELNDD